MVDVGFDVDGGSAGWSDFRYERDYYVDGESAGWWLRLTSDMKERDY